jgi:hypothetical protein
VVGRCDFEKILLKNALKVISDSIEKLVGEDMDSEFPSIVIKLIEAKTMIETALKCIENL